MNMCFTSESVTEGHPDKLCDQISDAVLDAYLAQDKNSRVACETLATTGMIVVAGEISSEASVDIPSIVRKTIAEIGYTDSSKCCFDANSCAVLTTVGKQSPDIAAGVDSSVENKESADSCYDLLGAGDQGLMFGFACSQTENLMPAPIYYAHLLTKRLAEIRKSGMCPFILPDGKAQVSMEFDENNRPCACSSIVVSSQHTPDASNREIHDAIYSEVIKKIIPEKLIKKDTKIFINPTGRFVIGGPVGDAGLTGRKIIVDTYGGYAPHGGGAFSGKDPTKVDRSAAYMARYAAKNIVAAGLADSCLLQIAYAIGVAHPVSVLVDTKGTGIMPDERLASLIREKFDFRPSSIIEKLDLRRPIYKKTAAYGHFGRNDIDVPWEKTDMAETLAQYK